MVPALPDVADFVEWLRAHNDERAEDDEDVGFYELDLYSLHSSAEAVIRYLDAVDPEAANRARQRYGCFDHFDDDLQEYGHAIAVGAAEPCEDEVVAQLLELHERAGDLARRDGRVPNDALFFAQQNARLVQNAERYHRAIFRGRASSWNLRDEHMADMLDALRQHLPPPGKVIVWAHNSHIGDASATGTAERGELNLGQLARARYGLDALLIGFTTHEGTFTAASDWGGRVRRRHVRPALPGSWESEFHATGLERFFLPVRGSSWSERPPPISLLERAIGVIYRPESERSSHYFHARIAAQFDGVIHIDRTSAVEPLERTSEWETDEAPQTYPSGV